MKVAEFFDELEVAGLYPARRDGQGNELFSRLLWKLMTNNIDQKYLGSSLEKVVT